MLFLGNFLYCQWTLVEPNPTNNNFDEKITKINFVKILDLRIFRPRNKLMEITHHVEKILRYTVITKIQTGLKVKTY